MMNRAQTIRARVEHLMSTGRVLRDDTDKFRLRMFVIGVVLNVLLLPVFIYGCLKIYEFVFLHHGL